MDISGAALVVASYLSGSFPGSYLVARFAKGIDIREHGSKNPGAANVYRVVGRWAGVATLIIDTAKGWLPVFAALHLFPDKPMIALLTGAAAIAGHIWTIFLRFSGGKGVATTAGVFLALLPGAMPPTYMVFAAAMAFSGHISAGSIASAAVFPFIAFAVGAPEPCLGLAVAACLLILVKHIPNMRRLAGADESPASQEGAP